MRRSRVLLLGLALAFVIAEPSSAWAKAGRKRTRSSSSAALVQAGAKATKSAKSTKSAKLAKKSKKKKSRRGATAPAEETSVAETPPAAQLMPALAIETPPPAPVEAVAPTTGAAPAPELASLSVPATPPQGAPPTLEESAPTSAPGLGLGLFPKVGGVFPQALNRLGTSYNVALELSYLTPLLGRQLAFGVEASYAQPPHSRTISDPRVPGGAASYTITERVLGVYAGPKYYFLAPSSRVLPYLSAGVRAQMISTDLEGNAGASTFAEQSETGTHVAFAGQAGVGLKLGPGHAVLELQATSSPIDHFVTGKVDVGDLGLRAGYLLQL